MAHSKSRQVRRELEPDTSKTPKSNKDLSDANLSFSWRVNDKYIDYDYEKLGWCNCDSVTLLKNAIKGLQEYEGLTWQQVRERNENNHPWDFMSLPPELRKRLQELKLDYLQELYQIALARKPRIWGYKEISIFYLIWYDPHHEGYKTKVK